MLDIINIIDITFDCFNSECRTSNLIHRIITFVLDTGIAFMDTLCRKLSSMSNKIVFILYVIMQCVQRLAIILDNSTLADI